MSAPCVSVLVMTTNNPAQPASGHPAHCAGETAESAAGCRTLNRGTVVLWRSRRVAQLELGTRRLVVENIDPDDMSALLSRPGDDPRPPPELPDTDRLAELTRRLDQAGFLTSIAMRQRARQAQTPARLTADTVALATQFGDRAPAVLLARRAAAVAVHGRSRLAASLATTLAAAGIGSVRLVSGGEVSAGDACPGGLTPADEGRRFAMAGEEAVRRYAPEVDTRPASPRRSADLVVLTDDAAPDPSLRGALHEDRVAHLVTRVDGQHGVVGPLVLPGVSSCLRCADLHRTDRDPAWPGLAVQLSARPRRRIGSDVALCVATVGVAVGQALSYLDRQPPTTVDATLEWQLPDWRLRRRSWPAHHRCDCGAATVTGKHGRIGP